MSDTQTLSKKQIPQQQALEREVQALSTLNASIDTLEKEAFDSTTLKNIIEAKFFTPEQDHTIGKWFAHFLTIRQNLWSIVDNAIDMTGGISAIKHQENNDANADNPNHENWIYFLIGYSAVCALVRLDNFLLKGFAYHSIVQRKLNEGFKEYRIERKQWTAIYRALTLPSNAYKIISAHNAYKKYQPNIAIAINTLAFQNTAKQLLLELLSTIPKQEKYLNLRWYKCLWAGLNYRYHSWRRRNASFKQQSKHTLLEYSGRIVSEIKLPTEKRVSKPILKQLKPILEYGDIVITRHSGALTNLFLPGFWPHAFLYIGDENLKDNIKPYIQQNTANQTSAIDGWHSNICTFEALKDGVHFRTLDASLNVDAFTVLRPNVSKEVKYEAIARATAHAGKNYNFDFDFFRSDQLVCTEVIYRAYQDVAGTNIPLVERMGRQTLSAEDLLNFSVDTNWATPIAIYGVSSEQHKLNSNNKILFGDDVLPALIESYRT